VKQETENWINIKLKEYPIQYDNSTSLAFEGISTPIEMIMFLMFGSYFIQLAFVATWVILLYYVVFEKENMLRFGVTMMGVDGYVYWLSWISTGLILIFFSAVSSIVMGIVWRMPFFVNANFFVLLIIFMSFGFSLIAMCLLIAAVINTVKAASTLYYILYSCL